MPRAGVSEVPLFSGNRSVYGDAYENPFRPGSYKSTLHGIVDSGGFAPFFQVEGGNAWQPAAAAGSHVLQAVEWENSAGDPIILVATEHGLRNAKSSLTDSARVSRINPDGTVSEDSGGEGDEFGIIPFALHSNGGTTPLLFACYETAQNIRSRTAAGTWAATSGTPSQARALFSENGNLWAVLTNGYQVQKWAAGTNPQSATAGAARDVGDASSKINGAGLLGQSVMVWVKPDGIYLYDIDTERFENIWEGLNKNPHPLTGIGTFTWGNEVIVPLGWGGAVRVLPGPSVVPASPLPIEALPDHTVQGRSRILNMASDAQYLYASIEPFTQRLGVGGTPPVYVRTTTDDVAFNNRDSVATDNDLATSFTHADMEPQPGFIYIGSDRRFRGIWLEIVGGGTIVTFLWEYWNGSTWAVLGARDYTAFLLQSGAIVPDVIIPSNWTETAINSQNAFWIRLRIEVDQAVNSEYREVRILPEVADLVSGTNVVGSGDDEAGIRQHIIRGYPVGRQMAWDDIISLDRMAEVLIFSQVLAPAGGRSLYILGPVGARRIPMEPSGRPAEERYAHVQNGFASLFRSRYTSQIALGVLAPTLLKGIQYVTVHTRNFDRVNDLVQVWAAFDGQAPFLMGKGKDSLVTLELPRNEAPRGYRYSVIVGIEDGARDELIPVVTDVVAGVYPISGTRAQDR